MYLYKDGKSWSSGERISGALSGSKSYQYQTIAPPAESLLCPTIASEKPISDLLPRASLKRKPIGGVGQFYFTMLLLINVYSCTRIWVCIITIKLCCLVRTDPPQSTIKPRNISRTNKGPICNIP